YISSNPGAGRYDVLTGPGDPYRIAIKKFLPASAGKFLHEPVADGVPMIKLGAAALPPNALHAIDLFEQDFRESQRWFVADNRLSRVVKDVRPARFVFQYVESDQRLDDFLHPPKEPNRQKVARIHYQDLRGHA